MKNYLFLIHLVLVFFSSSSLAAGTVLPVPSWASPAGTGNYSTALAACQAYVPTVTSANSSGMCFIGTTYAGIQALTRAASCPVGSTLSGSTCTCNGSTVPNSGGTACVAPAAPLVCPVGMHQFGSACVNDLNCSQASSDLSTSFATNGPPAGSVTSSITACISGCVMTYSKFSSSPDTSTLTSVGSSCTASASTVNGLPLAQLSPASAVAAADTAAAALAAAKTIAQAKAITDAAAAGAAAAAAASAAASQAAAAAGGSASAVAAAGASAGAAAAGAAAASASLANSQPQTKITCADTNTCTNGAAASPGALPSSVGGWYTPTYPNGIGGVIIAKFNDLKATPLAGLIQNLVPTISGPALSGCFSFTVWKLGAMPLCIPPGVLSFLGVVMMLSAMFSARAIIFGG